MDCVLLIQKHIDELSSFGIFVDTSGRFLQRQGGRFRSEDSLVGNELRPSYQYYSNEPEQHIQGLSITVFEFRMQQSDPIPCSLPND